jgi:EmrB/QacA subfamily drug resistance transporter
MVAKLQSLEYKWIVAIAFLLGIFMDLLDMTIVNVALPSIAKDFNVTEGGIEWLITGYTLSLAVWIPASGWLGDRFGTKRIFMLAITAFTIGSFLCAMAWSLNSLIFFRVLQGVGGGMMTPVGTAMLMRAFPPSERARSSTVLMVPIAVAPAVGPVLGGVLVDQLSWEWIFLINLPIGVLAFAFAFFMLKEERQSTAGPFDLRGFLLSGAGLPLLLYGISEGPSSGWGSAKVLVPAIAGLALLTTLVLVETRVPHPLLTLRLFSDRMFRTGNILMFLMAGGMFGALFLLPLFLQQMKGLSATNSGLTTFPQAIGMIIASQVTTRIYPKVGPKRMVLVGGLGVTLTSICFLFVGLGTSLWAIRGIMFVRGLFFNTTIVPLQAATYATIQRQDQGRASSLYSTTRQVGGSVGVAILSTVLTQRMTTETGGLTDPAAIASGSVSAFHWAFAAAVILSSLATLGGFMIRDEDARATMAPRTKPKTAETPAPQQATEEPALAH